MGSYGELFEGTSAAWRSAFAATFTFPEPPMIEPYIVKIKKIVETIISTAKEATVILEVPTYYRGYNYLLQKKTEI